MTGAHRAPEPEAISGGRHRSDQRATRKSHRRLFDAAGIHRREQTTWLGRLAPPVVVSAAIVTSLALNTTTTAPDVTGPHGAPGGIVWPWAASGSYQDSANGRMVQVASMTGDQPDVPGASADVTTETSPSGVAPSGDAGEPGVPRAEDSPSAGDVPTTEPTTADPSPWPTVTLPPITLPSIPVPDPTDVLPTLPTDEPTPADPEPTPSASDPAPSDDPTTAPTQGPVISVPPVVVPPVCISVKVG